MSESTLQHLSPNGTSRLLCVVAHPDDLEYGSSALVAQWADAGVEVAYLLLTAGEAGMQRDPAEVGPLRIEEQRAACDIIGVSHLTVLDHPDGNLADPLRLRLDIAAEIRAFRPDAVLTQTWELEVGWGINHADHRAAGLATADAIRDAGNRWVFTELLDDGLEPWAASWLIVGGHTAPNHAVPVDPAAVDKAVASLAAHSAYLADLPDHPAPADFIPPMLKAGGDAAGVPYAVAVRTWRM
ncbi:MAG: PIG-L deacetylase family protein [Arachnia sp.]